MLSRISIDEKVANLTVSIIIIFYSTVIIMSSFAPESIYMSNELRELLSLNMSYTLSSETAVIIINNLLVYFSMFISSKVVASLKKNKSLSERKTSILTGTIIIFYIFFFALQGFRVGIELNSNIYNDYWFSFYTLVFPHGFFEMTGFALISSASFYYFFEHLNKSDFIRLAKVGAIIIVFSGIIETTLTPFIFKKLLLIV